MKGNHFNIHLSIKKLFKPLIDIIIYEIIRREQEKAFILSNTKARKSWFGSAFTKCFFYLDVKGNCLKYYKDAKMTDEKGRINLSEVTDIAYSKVVDAPNFAIDLITEFRYYTIAAETHMEIIRWAFAIQHARKKHKYALNAEVSGGENSRYYRFEVTFPVKSQLHMNVMGSMNRTTKSGRVLRHWMVVVGFERNEQGLPGLAESCGKIMKKDFIEAVNGVDITVLTFDESMDLIANAVWPLTLRFIRDKHASVFPSDIEGWGAVLYPSLQRRRKRYIELRDNELSFRKPAPGGSAMANREAFVYLDSFSKILQLQDQNLPEEHQYILRLVCKEDARINHVDDGGDPMGISSVKEIDLYFKRPSHLEQWSLKIAESCTPHLRREPLMIIPMEEPRTNEELESSPSALLAIWSELTGRFATRYFFILEGTLHWHRPGTPRTKARKVCLANAGNCFIEAVEAVEDIHEPSSFKFQIRLTIVSWEIKLIIGIQSLETLLQFLLKIRECVEVAPAHKRVTVPTECTRSTDVLKKGVTESASAPPSASPGPGSSAIPDLAATRRGSQMTLQTEAEDTASVGAGVVIEGYLFKKGDKSGMAESLGLSAYRLRWFVLRDMELLYYKSRLQFQSGEKPSGVIDLRHVYHVRESEDPKVSGGSGWDSGSDYSVPTGKRVNKRGGGGHVDDSRWCVSVCVCVFVSLRCRRTVSRSILRTVSTSWWRRTRRVRGGGWRRWETPWRRGRRRWRSPCRPRRR